MRDCVSDHDNDESGEDHDLHHEEPEAHAHPRIGLHVCYVHQRLEHAGGQNERAQEVNGMTAGSADLQRQHDRAEHRQVLDAVGMRSRRALIPVWALTQI